MIENVINGNSVYCFEIGDSANVLKRIPDNSIDCIIASPPYWQQRIYEKNGEIISATGVTGKKYLSQIQCSEVLSEEEKQNALSALNETLDEMKRGEVVDFRMTIRGEQRVYHSESKKISGRAKELSEKGFFIVKMRKKGFLPSNIWRIVPEDIWRKDAHCAVFPEELLRVPILSTCPVGGIVLDPFSGTGSTVDAAVRLGRKGIGIDLSNQYTEVAKRRLCETTKNFNDFSFYGR